ncbi:MFS transporter [Paraburkholderia sp. 32]|uniref:MFS transporter n=1 Tax=Paraburkholderia sp. 32 TaxID=2991057 RepID=UPI003D262F99
MFNNRLSGWWTVLAGTLATTVGAGTIGTFMFGIFAKSIGEEFDWPRTSVSLGLTAFVIGNGIGVYLIGAAIDRWGARRTTGVMITVFGLTISSIGILPPSLPLFITAFAIIGFSGAAATLIPYAVAVCAHFDQRRGLALGLVNAGNGLGGILLPLFAFPLLHTFGWRVGYIAMGLICTLIPLLGIAFLVRMPRKFEEERKAQRTSSGSVDSVSFLRQKHFWLIAVSICLISFSTFGLMSQMVPILTDRGYAAGVAAGVLAAAGTSSLCARLGVGLVIDRIFAPYVTSAIFVAAMSGIWLIVHGDSITTITVGAILLGVGLGAEGDLITFLVSRYFPIHSFGKVTGAVWMTFAWGGAGGTLLISKGYDSFKSYSLVANLYIVMIGVAVVCVLSLGEYIFPPVHRVSKRDIRFVSDQN